MLGVVDCGAALDVEEDGAAEEAVLFEAEVSGVELLGGVVAVVLLEAVVLVFGLVALMLPEFTSVPLAVLPALPEEAGPGVALAIVSLLDCWLWLLALGGFVVELEPLGEVDVAGVSLLVGGVAPCEAGLTFVPEAGGTATDGLADGFEASVALDELVLPLDAALPVVPPVVLLGLELLAPVLLHEEEIMLTELTFRMFSAVPLMEPLVLLEAAPGALDPLPTVPDTATSCPTWLLKSDEPPCSCHTLPD